MQGHDHADDHHHVHFDDAASVERAEHEGDALSALLDQAMAAVAGEVMDPAAIRRIVDIGCGPGVGTAALAAQFPHAAVTAADGSAAMLDRAHERFAAVGLADRIDTVLVELPDGVEALPPADLLWASMVVHHVGDEAALLRQLRHRVNPGGVLALVEHASPVELIVDRRAGHRNAADRTAGDPDAVDIDGVWARVQDAWAEWFAAMRASLPGTTASADHAAMLQGAGFTVRRDEVISVEVDPRRDAASERFVADQLARSTRHLADHLCAEDIATVDRLLGDGGRTPTGISLRVSRRLLLAV